MTDEDLFPKEPNAIWFAVFVTEFIVKFMVNAFTINAFARKQHLRKSSTYLIINLTAADLLVGAVTGPVRLYISLEVESCQAFIWKCFIIVNLSDIFSASSLGKLTLIALERLHATLCPLRHCFIEEVAYVKIVLCSWLLALLLAFVGAVLYQYKSAAILYLWISYIVVSLLIQIISYVVIIIEVKSSPRPRDRHFGSDISDRKLSVTLFIVTVVSILTILPWAICAVIPIGVREQKIQSPIIYTVYVLYYASSLVNPLIYAMRTQGFRKVLTTPFYKNTTESIGVQTIELNSM